jgi:hypothetical protein
MRIVRQLPDLSDATSPRSAYTFDGVVCQIPKFTPIKTGAVCFNEPYFSAAVDLFEIAYYAINLPNKTKPASHDITGIITINRYDMA